jgi:hypothetical protein
MAAERPWDQRRRIGPNSVLDQLPGVRDSIESMYRDDKDALLARADATAREADDLRRENEAMRLAIGQAAVVPPPAYFALPPPQVVYGPMADVRMWAMSERARLAHHSVERFPVWAVAVLHIVTLGLFPLIHFGLLHDRLPRAAHNDPSSGKAIGFQFIPYFNLYWVFFSVLRLCDRLNLQLRLRGEEPRAPRGFGIATCIFSVVPYLNILIGYPIMWTIMVCRLQSTVNRVAALPPSSWDATTP